MEHRKLQNNLIKLNIYAFFLTFLVVIPVIVPFFQAKGLSLKDVFLLQGIFGMALICFDVPAGYLADYLGRKKMMVLGSIISALGYSVLSIGSSFQHFALFEIIVGLGLSFQSGCDVAILYNTVEKLKLVGSKSKFLGQRIMSNTTGEGVASLLGGALVGFSLDLPATVNAVMAWIPVLVALTIYDPPGQSLPKGSHLQNLKNISKALFGHSKLLSFVILNFIFYSFATYCAIWSLQAYWKERGIAVGLFGYLWAANSFAVALVSFFTHRIEKKIGPVKVIILISLLPVVGYLGMGFSGGLIGLVFTLAFPVCRGLNQVIFQDAINSRVPAEIRATANSVGSLGMRALFVVFGPLLGFYIDKYGTNEAMKLMGVVYLAGLFLVAMPLLSQRREFKVG